MRERDRKREVEREKERKNGVILEGVRRSEGIRNVRNVSVTSDAGWWEVTCLRQHVNHHVSMSCDPHVVK